ncbi:MAG TPA: protein kinase [Polyangia bacterium]
MTAAEGTPYFQEGQLVGRYQIVRLIGEGGMGAVYEALHPGLKKRVAVKVLLPRIAQKEEARVRFLREGEAASRINHPHVVAVFDVGEDGEQAGEEDRRVPYLVMEYLEGRTLSDFLAARGALAVADALALFLPIVAAVSAGHDSGVVHRDLKPHNIFLANGRWDELVPKVLDFGVSKLIDHAGPPVTRTDAVLGTASYMSPEQARGARHVDARSDQFTLGLILYEMVTGQRALRGDNDLEVLYNAAIAGIAPANQVKPGLPETLYGALARMLATAPGDRFPSLRDAGQVLLPLANDKTKAAVATDFRGSPAGTSEPTGPAPDPGSIGGVAAAAPSARSGGTATPATPASSPGGTLSLPSALDDDDALDRPENTTLRQAAIESTFRMRARRRWPWASAKIVGGAASVLVILALVVAWRSARTGSAPTTGNSAVPVPERLAPPAPTTGTPSRPEAPPSAPPVVKAVETAEPASPTVPFEVRAFPPEADVELDGRQPVPGRLRIVLPLAGSSHHIRVSAPGYAPKTVSFGADQPPPAEIRLDKLTPSPSARAPRGGATKAPRAAKPSAPKRGTNNALIIK